MTFPSGTFDGAYPEVEVPTNGDNPDINHNSDVQTSQLSSMYKYVLLYWVRTGIDHGCVLAPQGNSGMVISHEASEPRNTIISTTPLAPSLSSFSDLIRMRPQRVYQINRDELTSIPYSNPGV